MHQRHSVGWWLWRAALAGGAVWMAGTGTVAAAGYPEPVEAPHIGSVSPDTALLDSSGTEPARSLHEVAQLKSIARNDSRTAPRRASPRTVPHGGGATPAPPEAAWVLGLLYLHGIAVPVDAAAARAWFERARLLGHPLAPAGLAWCEIDGCGAPANPAAAARWIALLRPVAPGRADYLQWLADMRLSPVQLSQPTVRQSAALPPVAQRALLQRAARAGDAQALVELGFDGVATGRRDEALAHFQAAAGLSPSAAYNAQILRSTQASSAIAPAGSPDSGAQAFLLARRYHLGDGVPANFSEALRLYRLAADAGHAQATRMLSLIYSRPAPDGQIDPAWMRQVADMDLAPRVPVLAAPVGTMALRRDPTPLFDLLPARWATRQRS